MRYAICYVSTASPNLPLPQVQEILKRSEINNNEQDITGILLYSEGNFLQILEGDETQLKSLYETIQEDSRHYDLIKIFEKQVDRSSYDEYTCSFISADIVQEEESLEEYISHVESLNPAVRRPVNYILQKFLGQA